MFNGKVKILPVLLWMQC